MDFEVTGKVEYNILCSSGMLLIEIILLTQ